jgi:kynureninase
MGLREDAAELDASDPLAGLRSAFLLPPGKIYLDGNSLGPPAHRVLERLDAVARGEWGGDLIASWNCHRWIDLPRRAAAKIARLINAAPDEVLVADSTSVNLFKLIAAALAMNPGRRTILSERGNFPSDLYIAEGVASLIGARLKIAHTDALEAALDDGVALLVLSHVDYRTGRLHDIDGMTRLAQARGALVLWDLAHSVGAMEIDVTRAKADFAVGCGYKYLNGGPGAPAFLYVPARHQDKARQPLQGWFGHGAQFAFEERYRPAAGIARFQCGTPPILSLAALDAALELWDGVALAEVRRKSLRLTELFMRAVDEYCAGAGLRLLTPRIGDRRGSHVSYAAPEDGYAVMQALIARGVVGDFRAPDILRFGFAPLYLTHAETVEAAAILGEVLQSRAWDRPEYRARAHVT